MIKQLGCAVSWALPEHYEVLVAGVLVGVAMRITWGVDLGRFGAVVVTAPDAEVPWRVLDERFDSAAEAADAVLAASRGSR